MASDRTSPRSSSPGRRWRASRPLARLTAALLLVVATTGAQALPERFSAYYQVTHAGLTLGEAQVEYRQTGPDRYRYSSHTRPLGLAALVLRSEIKEVSIGRITDHGFQPIRYKYDRSGRKAREAELRFDWNRMRVVNNVAGNAWDLEIPEDTLDRMVSQLQLMHDLANREQDLVYRIADGGRLKEYTLRIMGREKLQTPYGQLETLKIVRLTDNDRRATTFWCAPALDYLPVRVDHREKDDNFTMTLRDTSGFAVELAGRAQPGLGTGAALAASLTSLP